MPALLYKFQEQEHRFPLKDRTAIGRDRGNDLCLPCDSISSLHAVITREENGYQLEDAGSSNGIVVAGRRVSSCLLRDGDMFALGGVEFAFTLDGAVAEPALRAGTPPPDPTDPSDPSDPSDQPATVEEAPAPGASPAPPEEVIARFEKARERVLGEIGKVIVGQRDVLNQMLVALLARGHCLLIGVPGLAKTLMVRTLGGALDLESRRIQFTPDLMPTDITGTDILEEDSVTGKRAFRFHRGPVFTNLLLADEINRTPPKTQAALLEAMQEQRVTISGTSYDLPSPFMVLATQNPIEQEGTYPLPEAQLDRFMFCVHLAYPSAQEEQQVILDTTRDAPAAVDRVLDAAQVLELQQLVRRVPVSPHVALYALGLVRATRPNAEGSLDFVNRWVHWGAGPRAGQYLLLAAKTHVLLQGRFSVSCADVREYALPVLRHRIFPTFTAASESVTTDQIVKKIVAAVKEPQY
jgi:MoxR-like ATPase